MSGYRYFVRKIWESLVHNPSYACDVRIERTAKYIDHMCKGILEPRTAVRARQLNSLVGEHLHHGHMSILKGEQRPERYELVSYSKGWQVCTVGRK